MLPLTVKCTDESIQFNNWATFQQQDFVSTCYRAFTMSWKFLQVTVPSQCHGSFYKLPCLHNVMEVSTRYRAFTMLWKFLQVTAPSQCYGSFYKLPCLHNVIEVSTSYHAFTMLWKFLQVTMASQCYGSFYKLPCLNVMEVIGSSLSTPIWNTSNNWRWSSFRNLN